MSIKLSEKEIAWLESYPDGLRAAADYHATQSTEANAMGYYEASTWHDNRCFELMEEAKRIEAEA